MTAQGVSLEKRCESLSLVQRGFPTSTIVSGTEEDEDKGYQHGLRCLELTGTIFEKDVLPRLFRRLPLLQELTLARGWSRFDHNAWVTLSQHCRHLKALQICGYSHYHVEFEDFDNLGILAMFPELEVLRVVEFPRRQIELTAFESTLVKFEQQHQRSHPLKALCIAGHFHDKLIKLLDILSSKSLKRLESLKIGPAYDSSVFRERPSMPETSASGLSHDFTRSWESVARTLLRLDLYGIVFPDKVVMERFWERLQGLERLRVLRVSVHHIQDLFATNTSSRLSSTMTTATAGTETEGTSLDGKKQPMALPIVDYRFPSIHTFMAARRWICAPSGQGSNPTVQDTLSLDQVLFLLAMTPSLKNLLLTYWCVEKEIAAVIRSEFRNVFVDTRQEEFLPWFS
ncbi:hypothetical protein BGW39_006288 [Mortierella sp. 14UC]|nr:hypothetical protein BGW39_006288 [Mortierella sp. 14UC]